MLLIKERIILIIFSLLVALSLLYCFFHLTNYLFLLYYVVPILVVSLFQEIHEILLNVIFQAKYEISIHFMISSL